MNTLIIGSQKEPILQYLPDCFLLIDDGPLIDQLELPKRRAVTMFDVKRHRFNPLRGMDYRRARDFVAVLNAVFPEGENTLTKARSTYQLLEALLAGPKSLDTLIAPSKDTADAYQKVQTLLLSPVLNAVLQGPTSLSFKGTIIARLDRAELGDFDCFVLANLLISQYPGPVVIPDFGFYGHKGHTGLIRQTRLIAGINSFDELPDLRSQLILIERKIASRATPEDAKLLATYAGITQGTNLYNDFIARSIA